MPNNRYSVPVAVEPGATASRLLFKRPTTVQWSQIGPQFSPGLGQSVRLREYYRVLISFDTTLTIYRNERRYFPVVNAGHYERFYSLPGNEFAIEKSEEIELPLDTNNATSGYLTVSYERDYRLYRTLGDFFGASYGAIDACNADLEPSAVPNGFINSSNVSEYVSILAKAVGGNWLGAAADLVSLTEPTTQGFRFPDKKNLFNVFTQLLAVDLAAYSIATAIGDLGIYLNPGCSVSSCEYVIEAREFGVILPLVNQISAASCTYLPGVVIPFPTGSTSAACEAEFNLQSFANQSPYRDLAVCQAAAVASGIPGVTCDPELLVCSTDPTQTRTVYNISGGV